MNHDKFCNNYVKMEDGSCAECASIEKIRADERNMAAARIKQSMFGQNKLPIKAGMKILAAARGGKQT